MSKHAWLLTPNRERAVRLLESYRLALVEGESTGEQAVTFAGWCEERRAQGGTGEDPHALLARARFRWKIVEGKKARNYREVVYRHVQFYLIDLADACGLDWAQMIAQLGDLGAAKVIWDYVEEHDVAETKFGEKEILELDLAGWYLKEIE